MTDHSVELAVAACGPMAIRTSTASGIAAQAAANRRRLPTSLAGAILAASVMTGHVSLEALVPKPGLEPMRSLGVAGPVPARQRGPERGDFGHAHAPGCHRRGHWQ